jgi:hypothetical protein
MRRREFLGMLGGAMAPSMLWPLRSAAQAQTQIQAWPAKPGEDRGGVRAGRRRRPVRAHAGGEMSSTFKQQFYVENIAGSAGADRLGQVARARPTAIPAGSAAPARC